jgi:hypothetical protein
VTDSAGQGDWRITHALELYNQCEELLKRYAKTGNFLDNTILIFSVVTSGAFWALASDALPKLLGWIGAAISTLVTGLTIYMHTSAVNQKRKKAQLVAQELGKFVAQIRGNPNLPDPEYWVHYKFFEAKIMELRYGRGDE